MTATDYEEMRERRLGLAIRRNKTPFGALYTSIYMIDETLTLLKDRCGSEVAISFRQDLEASLTVRPL